MGNITENKINQILTAADIAAISTSIAAIDAKLPKGSLTDDQRANLKAINVDNKVFVEDAITEIIANGAGIIPTFISAVNIQNDITLFDQLDAVESSLNTLLRKISDIKRIVGDEGYTGGLVAYHLFEGANLAGINTAKESYEKLKVRFNNQGGNGRPEVQV